MKTPKEVLRDIGTIMLCVSGALLVVAYFWDLILDVLKVPYQ